MTTTWNEATPEAADVAKGTLKAYLVYYRTRGFVPLEIAGKVCRNMTSGQMRRTAATLFDINEGLVAEEVVKLADKAEAEEAREAAERKARTGTHVYYICDEDGGVLDITGGIPYTAALFQRDCVAEKYGVDPESLDVLTKEQYADEYGEGA